MNNEMLRLAKQAEDLQVTLKQLAEKDSLTIIDKDLLKHHCLLMYEQLSALSLTGNPSPLPVESVFVPQPEPIIPEPVIVEPVAEPIVAAPEKIVDVPLPPVVQQPLFEEGLTLNDLAKAAEAPTVKLPPTETEILNNTIDTILEQQQEKKEKTAPDPEISLHEKIASSLDTRENLLGKLSASIPSLKTAINVNLKIALVNQLFNENTVEYVKAIDKLNSCENIHEAMRYFNELKHQYAWDSENHNVRELEQLLTKRYNS